MPDGKQVRLLNEVEPPLLRQFTDEVAELIDDRLPLMFPPEDRWPPIAHGFLARAGTLLEAVTRMVEQELEGEAQMLLRVLFEHVTTFCWIAIDPEPHLVQWREWADSRQLKLHNDAKRFGLTVLTDAEVTAYKPAKPPLPLPQLTEAVDNYWSERSRAFRSLEGTADGFPSILTFTGFYTAVYRKGSRLIHADMSSVDRFATMPLLGQVTIHATEKHTESNDYPAFAAPFVGFLLIVFEDRFGWPAREVIDAATNALMYRDD